MTCFIKRPTEKGFISIPYNIFEDERLSIGAKGLFAQLYYSTDSITSLNDLTQVTTDTKEQIDAYFDELVKIGYIAFDKNNRPEFKLKPQKENTIAKKLNKDQVNEFKNTTIEPKPKMSAFEMLMKMIESYKFDIKVENLLKEYFTNWLNKVGRYADGDDLHGPVARACLNTLVSFQMSDEDMITCVKTSIDRQWRKFVDFRQGNQPTKPPINKSSKLDFDKLTVTSGSYTEEEIQKIKERSEKNNSDEVF